jgi:polyhydroxybutyrate depolymerase
VHPVVVLLHGGTEDAEQVWRQTSLPTLGQQEGFVVVAPNAINKHWDDGRGAVLGGKPSTADDVGFLRQVISEVITHYHGDPGAVFMTGPSNGGFMTMHFACHAGTILHAAANVISDLPEAEMADCSAPAMPWLSMNGTADPIVPFGGMKAGTIKNGQPQPALLSADATFHFWAERAHCGAFVSDDRLPHLNPEDPTSAEKRVCRGRNGIESIQYIFHGGGHTWPNAQYGALLRRIIGDSNQDVDAGKALWEFFKSTIRAGE